MKGVKEREASSSQLFTLIDEVLKMAPRGEGERQAAYDIMKILINPLTIQHDPTANTPPLSSSFLIRSFILALLHGNVYFLGLLNNLIHELTLRDENTLLDIKKKIKVKLKNRPYLIALLERLITGGASEDYHRHLQGALSIAWRINLLPDEEYRRLRQKLRFARSPARSLPLGEQGNRPSLYARKANASQLNGLASSVHDCLEEENLVSLANECFL